ncbi:TetR family transcriptional regulator [Georgenia sp. 10Sc9-8]|uniref:TetR family transcriptional regulator n=1 Tax=Georgenia halotolerans TaxID=3028317 RepID=A0ABT5TZT4_9MICO|nr:TetR family transcriptional regulator [Georgenia halotolerans]
MSGQEPGLRELKKQMTRENIADAAFRLTVEKGLEHVTVDEIAQQAFVSPRTVSNYFSGKEEAVVSAEEQEWFSLVYDFSQRSADEHPLDSLCEVVTEFARSRNKAQIDLIVQKADLAQRYPALQPFQAAQYEKVEEALYDEIVARTGGDSEELGMFPRLVAGVAVCALRTALRQWVSNGAQPEDLPDLLERAFRQVREGLPVPETTNDSTEG